MKFNLIREDESEEETCLIDNRNAPGWEQPRMGKTFPEMLDKAEARIEELEDLVEHWKTMWEIADAEVARLAAELNNEKD